MILHMYANFNTLAGFFGPMMAEKIEPEELKKDYIQIVTGLSKDKLESLKECDLYCLGSYDNVTGEIVPEKTFLLHCGEVVSLLFKSREVSEDGKVN